MMTVREITDFFRMLSCSGYEDEPVLCALSEDGGVASLAIDEAAFSISDGQGNNRVRIVLYIGPSSYK